MSLQRRGYTTTTADGTYTLEGLVAGDYLLAFIDCDTDMYAGSFYNDAQTSDNAQTITLTAAQVRSGIDASLAVGGSLSGTVTDADTGLPIENICVAAASANYTFVSNTETAADGAYTLTGLGNDYTLQFETCSSSGPQYVAEYYPGVLDQNAATQVHVDPGDTLTGYNMALDIGATISGTLTNHVTGKPLADVCLEAFMIAGNDLNDISSERVNSDGTYTLTGLPAGHFKVDAYHCGVPKFDDVWYNGKPSSANATVLTLTAGQMLTGIDFSITLDPVAGDGDCTGDVTMSDLMTGLQFLSGVDGGHNCASSSLNLDCNGATNGRDMLVLVRYLAGLPMNVPPNCPAPGALLP
jgi:5-hydroxyisourate hydrolase-like protein (transthyretin family)